ncbi:MAG: MFS transporter [Pseudomonadota bacterium]
MHDYQTHYSSINNKRLLIAAQALFVCCSAIGLTLSGLVGSLLAPSKEWATLPFALLTVATAISTLSVSQAMSRHGRRPLFIAGSLCGVAGGGLAALAIVQSSFITFCAANMLLGVFQACAQYYRFAVSEVVTAEARSRAVGHVVAAGLFAAVVGPTLATWARDVFAPHTFAGSYLAVLLLALASASILWSLRLGKPAIVNSVLQRDSVWRVLRLPGFGTAAANAAVGYTVMIFVMTATPLAVVGCGLPIGAAGSVIQWHLLSMFAPGLFSGKIVARWGSSRVMQLGALLFALGCGVAIAGSSLPHFGIALALNGLAWNLMYVAATHALTQALEHQKPQDRALGQSISEFLTFTMVALGSLLAGAVLNRLGWSSVNVVVLPLLVLSILMTLWHAQSQKPQAAMQS